MTENKNSFLKQAGYILSAPFRWIKKLFVSLQFKLAGLFIKKSLKKQAKESSANTQDIDSLKTMVMEFARQSYVGMSKDKRLIITMNGQFKVDDVKIDPSLSNNPKELRKALKQAITDVMQKIMGAMMGLTGGDVPKIPGMPF